MRCFSNCDEVELFLTARAWDGRRMGGFSSGVGGGVLARGAGGERVSRRQGRWWRTRNETSGAAAGIALEADRGSVRSRWGGCRGHDGSGGAMEKGGRMPKRIRI